MRAERLDYFGMAAGSLCAVHCALTALLPAVFSVIGLEILLAHQAEWALTLVAVAFAGGALVLGWRQHRSSWVATCLVLGIVGLLASRGLEEVGSPHHGHHGDDHTTVAERPVASGAEAAPDHGTSPDDHDGEHGDEPHAMFEVDLHLAGAAVGILSGIILMIGHLLNFRLTRRCHGDCP